MTIAEPTAYLTAVRPLACGASHGQAALTRWMRRGLERARGVDRRRLGRALDLHDRLLAGGHVEARVCAMPDFALDDRARMRLFHADAPPLEARMAVYADTARGVMEAAFAPGEAPPDLAAQVTCTGYEAPTALQRLAAARGWQGPRLLHLGHMGCFAALPAMAAAAAMLRGLAADPRRDAPAGGPRASLVFVELCTLHLDLAATDPDQIVIHHLFGDGAARVDCALQPTAGQASFALLDHFEAILPATESAMTWTLSATGFRMALARRVPHAVAAALPGLVSAMLARHGLYRSDVARWAIHPGGARIIDGVAQALELTEAQVRHSREVLRARGNMSSATIPHVWSALLADDDVAPGELVVSLAFGPGLTVTGNLMRKEAPV